jgi:S1-C subfamily serine protease
MFRPKFNYLSAGLAFAGLACAADHVSAQRSAGQTPPISRIEQRPNLGAGSAYRAPRNDVVRPLTLPQGQLPSRAATASASVGFGASFDRDVIKDIVINRVAAGSPAARAGLQRGDTIVSINNRRFANGNEAADYLRSFDGDRLNVLAMRKGAFVNLSADLAAAKGTTATSRTTLRPNTGTAPRRRGDPSATALNPSPNRATPSTQRIDNAPGFGFRLSDVPGGLVVSEVEQGSLASATGLRAGDRIMSLGGQRVRNPAEVDRILAGITTDPSLDILVARNGQAVDLTANLAAYTGFYSTADHSENVSNPSTARRFTRSNLQGLQTTLGATFARTPDGELAITRVMPNSYAARAGLRRGDLLYGLNGRTIAGPEDIMRFFSNLSPGTDVGFGIWRDGQNMALNADLDQTFFNDLATTARASGQTRQENVATDAQGNPIVSPQDRMAARNPATQQRGFTDARNARRDLDFNSQPANDSSGFDTNPQNDSTPDAIPSDVAPGTGSNLNDPLVDPQLNPQPNVLDNDFNTDDLNGDGINDGTNSIDVPVPFNGNQPNSQFPTRPSINPQQDPDGHQMQEKRSTNQGRFGNRSNNGRDAFSSESTSRPPSQGAAQGRPAANRPNQPATRSRELNSGRSLNVPNGRNTRAVRPSTERPSNRGSAFSSGEQPTGGNTGRTRAGTPNGTNQGGLGTNNQSGAAGGNQNSGKQNGGAQGGAAPGGSAAGRR